MADDTVAPKERVSIRYRTDTDGAQEGVELPFRILMVGDYTDRKDPTPLGDRKPVNVTKANFNSVMAAQKLEVAVAVPDRLTGETDAQLSATLSFGKLEDFGPDAIARNVPELQKLLELRKALSTLSYPLGAVPIFRKRLQALMADPVAREKLMQALGVDK